MISAIFAAILAIFFVFLSFQIIKQRQKSQTALGCGDNNIELERRIRAHGNFSEYSPLFLLLLFFLEFLKAAKIEITILGMIFVIGRMLHAYGMIKEEKYEGTKLVTPPNCRKKGMILTFLLINYLAIRLLYLGFLG